MNFRFFDAMFDALSSDSHQNNENWPKESGARRVGADGTHFGTFIDKQIPSRYLRDQKKSQNAPHALPTWVRYLFERGLVKRVIAVGESFGILGNTSNIRQLTDKLRTGCFIKAFHESASFSRGELILYTFLKTKPTTKRMSFVWLRVKAVMLDACFWILGKNFRAYDK